ncbi:MAG: redox-sensing transcriptional repressor Rex [Bacilli bacterium]|jgi:redox-sensing transcriptional repressor|nr:redox-sensing transcriptional repressor Rex [Bacilli bacterium]MCH4201933.1 redox-sensing transcriptional repressor Rex [Bacilli bacterium]MCH4235878.1 redox-sensing transcriptional repressor Rex [Bacilli bacterium]
MKRVNKISKNQLQRLPAYLYHLQMLRASGVNRVTSPQIAKDLDLNVELVKKDFALVSSTQGTPRAGRDIDDLIHDLIKFLEYDKESTAILVGCGSLGRALIGYRGFDDFGFNIVAAFDNNPDLIGTKIGELTIYPLERLNEIQSIKKAKIGIITVTAKAAQLVADQLVKAGIGAIWNFAPANLMLPSDIIVQDESMASSLAVLSHRLKMKERSLKRKLK